MPSFIRNFICRKNVTYCVFAILFLLNSCAPKLSKEEQQLIVKYENILESKIKPKKDLKLYKHIDSWWGTPYKIGGTTTKGVDCSGFSMITMKTVFNSEIPRKSADQAEIGRRVRKLKKGDLVFFSFDKQKISHVGVYLKNHRFVHASTSKGVRIDNITDKYYKNGYVKAKRIVRAK